jgi:glycosyltransferase involved in cell wall biosynthesis
MLATKNTRNVLIIAYYFPPMGLSGVQRTQKFVKYLPQFGWKPTVITVTPTGYLAEDYTLLDELKNVEAEIIRVGSLDLNRFFKKKGVVRMPSERVRKTLSFVSDIFFVPDNKIGWKGKVLKKVSELFESKKIDIIFATSPPYTDFLIGMELHKKYKIPLVIDYRDVWHEYPFKVYPTPLHKYFNYKLEKQVLHNAGKIITTNRKVKELLLSRYKFLNYNDVHIIHQGFDPADFEENIPAPRSPLNKMRITHAGVFYGERTPKYFFQALNKLFKQNPSLQNKIEVLFIGNFRKEDKKLIDQYNLGGVVAVLGYLDHQKTIQYLMSSDLFWLMIENDVQSPGKVYEYIGARKPILANIPEGFIKQTILEIDSNVALPPQDVDETAIAIKRFYEKFEKGEKPLVNSEIVERYNRITLTDELSNIFGFLTER